MSGSSERTSYIVLAIVGFLLLMLALVAFVSMSKTDRREECRLHLMSVIMTVQSSSPADAEAWDRVATGRRFFSDLAHWPARSPRELDQKTFTCPVLGRSPGGLDPANIDYRGPIKSIRNLQTTDVLAADRIGNHGPREGGNVLLRGGDIQAVGEDDVAWAKAATTTSD